MKKLKKALSLLLAGVTAVTALFCGSVSASAASSKKELITAALSDIDSNATKSDAIGQDVYLFYDDNTYTAAYRIGSEELNKWRSTGTPTATKIDIDKKLDGLYWCFYGSATLDYSDYLGAYYIDSNNITTNYVIKYDKKNNKLKVVYSSYNTLGIASDGTISEFSRDNEKGYITLKILNSNGKLVKKNKYPILKDAFIGTGVPFTFGGDYAHVLYAKGKNGDKTFDAVHAIVDTKGNSKIIYVLEGITAYGKCSANKNYQGFESVPNEGINKVYLFDNDKTYNLKNICKYKNYKLLNFGLMFNGTKTIATYIYQKDENAEPQYKCALVDVKSDKILSSLYEYMYTGDNGNTYLMQASNGKWGYLNSKGKKLGSFDYASVFSGNGKYAPVINNGKMYLIDKKMKRASTTMAVDNNTFVYTYGEELFLYIEGDTQYLMTYKS